MTEQASTYTPNPVDTSGVVLDEKLTMLTEVLAADAHESWARQRIADGWTYGPHRDDVAKTHPCLVPYDQLPESEKTYDRTLALQTIRVMLALGYRIEAPGALNLATLPSSVREQLLAMIGDQDELAAGAFQAAGEQHLKTGDALSAYDVVTQGLARFPTHVRLRQLQGLALARSGDTDRAMMVLQQLKNEGHADEESLGMLARTYKDLALSGLEPADRTRYLAEAARLYGEAYETTGGPWTGINAATMALLLGQRDDVRSIASRVMEKLGHDPSDDAYWALATQAEAALILEDWSRAKELYARAATAGRGRFGDLSSTRRNAHLLLQHFDRDARWLDEVLALPNVVVFAGHMIDRRDRRTPQFPSLLESAVRRAIEEHLDAMNGRIGYASAACGADILFHEVLAERGGESHVVLPFDREGFRRGSVDIDPGWGERYERVLARAKEVITASGQTVGQTNAFRYGNLLLHGLAKMHADRLGTALTGLAVWDGQPGDGPGGTASAVEMWRSFDVSVTVIDPAALVADSRRPARAAKRVGGGRNRSRPIARGFTTDIVAMLFADAVGFSKLTEPEIPRFVEHFLGLIADCLKVEGVTPLMRNTWGDGLYVVFANPTEAAEFALAVRDRVATTDWAAHGLPAGLTLRIALHGGPVFTCIDPVTRRRNWVGTHVSRAARIEPVTPPGQVYASQAFAALASSRVDNRFTFDYVGQVPLAKGYGSFPTYHVRRRVDDQRGQVQRNG